MKNSLYAAGDSSRIDMTVKASVYELRVVPGILRHKNRYRGVFLGGGVTYSKWAYAVKGIDRENDIFGSIADQLGWTWGLIGLAAARTGLLGIEAAITKGNFYVNLLICGDWF